MKHFLPLLLFGLVTPLFSALGVRSIILPPYETSINMDFRGRQPAIPENARLGFRIQAIIRLNNLSKVTQTGRLTVVMIPFESTVRMSHSLADFDRIVSTCAKTTATKTNSGTSIVEFEVSPESHQTILIEALFTNGRFCDPAAGTKCFRSATAIFNPFLKIEVNEDRGALMGTLNFLMNSGGSQVDAPLTTCSGANYTGGYTGPLGDILTFATLPINGGRPF